MTSRYVFVLAATLSVSADYAAALDPSSATIEMGVSAHGTTDRGFWTDSTSVSGSKQVSASGDHMYVGPRDVGPYQGTATSSALIQPGVIKVSGEAVISGANLGAHSSVGATFRDTLVVNGTQAQTGTMALVYYSISVQGTTDVSFERHNTSPDAPYNIVKPYTEWSVTHNAGQTSLSLLHRSEVDSIGNVTSSGKVNNVAGDPYGEHFLVLRAPINHAVTISTRLFGSTRFLIQGYEGATIEGSYDLGNSLYWGGISKITTLDGTPLDLTVTSASGMDYLKSYIPPVPEPSSWALLIAGLAVLPFARRKLH